MPAPSPGFQNSGVLVPEECVALGVGTRQTSDDSRQCKQRWQKHGCACRLAVPGSRDSLQTHRALLHAITPCTPPSPRTAPVKDLGCPDTLQGWGVGAGGGSGVPGAGGAAGEVGEHARPGGRGSRQGQHWAGAAGPSPLRRAQTRTRTCSVQRATWRPESFPGEPRSGLPQSAGVSSPSSPPATPHTQGARSFARSNLSSCCLTPME